LLLQPSVSNAAVSLLVSGLTVDIFGTFCGYFMVKCVFFSFVGDILGVIKCVVKKGTRVDCGLTVFDMFAVKWQKSVPERPKMHPPESLSWPRIWCPLKLSSAKREKICPADKSTVVQTFISISGTCAEISVGFCSRTHR